jgi:hypothetical protein
MSSYPHRTAWRLSYLLALFASPSNWLRSRYFYFLDASIPHQSYQAYLSLVHSVLHIHRPTHLLACFGTEFVV